ncbi:MAG: bacteriohemerythrin [Gammaproteobacteria bacterium]
MTLLHWKEEYSVGSPSVDHEHRELIEQINLWYENLREDVELDTRLAFLGEIYARISAHFALEEKLMRDFAYDEYEAHKADHELLLDQLRDIMDAEESGETYDSVALGSRLESWFSEHFRHKDARLHGRLG